MKTFPALCILLVPSMAFAQAPKVRALEEHVYILPAPDKYVWEKAAYLKGRTMFHNSIACTDSAVYSFGGYGGPVPYTHYCSYHVFREMHRLEGGKLIKENITYPGKGFMKNVFFILDSVMFIGGGADSCLTRYAWNDFWKYDMRSKTWKQLNDLPFYYHRPPTIFADGDDALLLIDRVYGEDFRQSSPVVYRYDHTVDKWDVVSKPLSETEIHAGLSCDTQGSYMRSVAFRLEGNLYLLFQREGQKQPGCSNSFFKLNLQTGDWTRLPPFPGWLESLAFAASDGAYGYIGGGLAYSIAYRKEAYRYDPLLARWERITNLPQGVIYANSWRFKGETYVGFGRNDDDLTIRVWKLQQRKRKKK
jgi:N-acetylneuraminic acid mutarotase